MAGALSSLFCGYILAKGYFAVASLWRYIKLPYPEEGIYFFFLLFSPKDSSHSKEARRDNKRER